MAGESGGELDASMLNVAMLDAAPGAFALEVGLSNVATSDAETLLVFAVGVEAAGASTADLEALLAFIAQVEASGQGTISVDALLAFAASQVELGGAGGVGLDARLQMLHAQGDLAYLVGQIAGEHRVITIYNEHRVMTPIMDEADVIANEDRAVTI